MIIYVKPILGPSPVFYILKKVQENLKQDALEFCVKLKKNFRATAGTMHSEMVEKSRNRRKDSLVQRAVKFYEIQQPL